ncbi:MAG: hypothetical protein ACI9SJ_001007 [Flavobacteriaceae bacterium]|jgi:hypothetical protein|uniref:DUF998 domain-containing protein n=1 Tax=Candidatus Marifrigoribacter sp. Uisw_064 TaxID=3230970 RepID=UPI003AEC0A93
MSNKLLFLIGILGVSLFAVASFLGGFQFENYDPISQYISETMAVGTPYGETLRLYGYIPSGILLTLFGFNAFKKFPKSSLTKIGFWGFGIFYGIATIVVGVFPCDQGCNKELIDPSISQIIHNLTGFLTYVFVPISILIVSIGLRNSKNFLKLSTIGFICGLFSIVFVGLLISDPSTNYAGLFQRIIESIFIIWIIACAFNIKKSIGF